MATLAAVAAPVSFFCSASETPVFCSACCVGLRAKRSGGNNEKMAAKIKNLSKFIDFFIITENGNGKGIVEFNHWW